MPWLPVVAVLLLAANGAFVAWTYAGLETVFFTFLVLLGAWLHLREDAGESTLPLSAFALLLAALTRPEGVLFFAVTGLFKAYGWWRAGRSRQQLFALALWGVVFVVPYAAYFAWHWSYYDYPFPNSYYAKVGSGMDQYERGLTYVVDFGRAYGILLALLIPVPMVAWRERRLESAYVITLLLAWTGYLIYVGGDGLPQHRMFIPVLPFLYLLAVAGGLHVLAELRRSAGRWPVYSLACVALIVVLAVTLQPSADQSARRRRLVVPDGETVGKWLHDNLPPSTVVAVSASGAVPYYSQLPAIDMLGLNDRHIAHSDIDLGAGFAGHEKFDSAYVLGRDPDLIFGSNFLVPGPLCLAADYIHHADASIPALYDLVHQPALFERYTPRSIELAPGLWMNVLARKGFDLPAYACEAILARHGEARTASVGETLTAGELQITVQGFEINRASLGQPPAGTVWVVVDARVANVGTGTIVVSDFLQTSLEDADGNRYSPVFDQPLSQTLNADLPAGETLDGSVAFTVPPDGTGLEFLFQAVGEVEPRRWVLEEPP